MKQLNILLLCSEYEKARSEMAVCVKDSSNAKHMKFEYTRNSAVQCTCAHFIFLICLFCLCIVDRKDDWWTPSVMDEQDSKYKWQRPCKLEGAHNWRYFEQVEGDDIGACSSSTS